MGKWAPISVSPRGWVVVRDWLRQIEPLLKQEQRDLVQLEKMKIQVMRRNLQLSPGYTIYASALSFNSLSNKTAIARDFTIFG